jgi:hypothetical protein
VKGGGCVHGDRCIHWLGIEEYFAASRFVFPLEVHIGNTLVSALVGAWGVCHWQDDAFSLRLEGRLQGKGA